MSRRLQSINDWLALTRLANYSPANMAGRCRVSLRTLELFFQEMFRTTPTCWTMDVRCLDAEEMLRQGYMTKVVARDLCFADAAHLCREIKKRYGVAPQQIFTLPTPTSHTKKIVFAVKHFAAVQKLRLDSIIACRPMSGTVFSSLRQTTKENYEQHQPSQDRLPLCNPGDPYSDALRAQRGSMLHDQSVPRSV